MELPMASSGQRNGPINQRTIKKIGRRSANYQPSLWGGDCFITAAQDDLMTTIKNKERIEELKLEVKRLLKAEEGQPVQMKLTDEIQRLGLAYDFEKEIDEALDRTHKSHTGDDFESNDELAALALRFRLLRHQDYNITSDVFKKLKDKDDNFKLRLCANAKGLLSSYEAAHLGTQGEQILEDATAFASKNLTDALADKLGSLLETQVRHALELPLHRGMPRLETRPFISLDQQWESHSYVLLELAKLDFKVLRLFHGQSFRLLEAVQWGAAFVYLKFTFGPHFSFGRTAVTKLISIASALDDTCDVHGTLEELESFAQVVERGLAPFAHSCIFECRRRGVEMKERDDPISAAIAGASLLRLEECPGDPSLVKQLDSICTI